MQIALEEGCFKNLKNNSIHIDNVWVFHILKAQLNLLTTMNPNLTWTSISKVKRVQDEIVRFRVSKRAPIVSGGFLPLPPYLFVSCHNNGSTLSPSSLLVTARASSSLSHACSLPHWNEECPFALLC